MSDLRYDLAETADRLEAERAAVVEQPRRVFNKYHRDAPPGAVYIGRGSPYGNPFVIGTNGDRDEVIAVHRDWIREQPELLERVRRDLAGKSLVCFCYPKPCHGDTLVEVADGTFQ